MTKTPTKAEELSDWLFAFASGKAESIMLCRAAAELRRLSAVEAERDALLAAIPSPAPVHQPAHGWTDADADAARLALELECILIDTDMPMAVTSRWWESAHEALALHRRRISDELREIECPPDPDAVDRALDADALRAGTERWRSLYARAINEANGLTNYVEDRPELRRAEKQLEAIQREARAIDAAMKGTT